MGSNRVEIVDEDAYTVVKPLGPLTDDAVTKEFTEVTENVCANNSRNVVLDLRNAPFMSSKTISTIVKFYKMQQHKRRQLVITNASQPLKMVFVATNLTKVVPVLDEAEFETWLKETEDFAPETSYIVEVRSEDRGEISLVWVDGDVGSVNSNDLKECFEDGFDGIDKPSAVIDVSNVIALDEQTIPAFIVLARKLEAKGGKMALAGANATVKELVEVHGLGEAVLFAADVRSAMALLGG